MTKPETPPSRLDEGCTAAIAALPRPTDTLKELERRCISSMRPLLDEPVLAELEEGTIADVPFALFDRTGCVRAAAAAEPSVAELELSIIDSRGRVCAETRVVAPLALLGEQGPLCFDRAGQYLVRLRLRRGAGRAAVGVWTSL